MSNSTNNVAFNYKQHINEKGATLLELCRAYLATTSDVVQNALMNEMNNYLKKGKIADFKDKVKSANDIEDIENYMWENEYFLTTICDAAYDATLFANEFFEKENFKVMVSVGGKDSICVKRFIGMKRQDLCTLLDIDDKEARTLFSTSKWLDIFVGKYLRKRIVDALDRNKGVLENDNIKIKLGDAYRACGLTDQSHTKRFVNMDLEFIIPISSLDTNTMGNIISLIKILEDDIKKYL